MNTIRRTLAATAAVTAIVALGAAGSAAAETPPWGGPGELPIGALPGDPLPPDPDPELNPDLDLPDFDVTDVTIPEEPPFPPDPEVNPDLDLPDLDLTDITIPEPPIDPCSPVDLGAFGITLVDNGDGTAAVQIGYVDGEDACDAPVTVTSYSTNVDQSAQAPLDDAATTVDELEAAALGDGWYLTDIALDPCFSTVDVAVDGTSLEVEHFGLGCSISVTKDFEGDPWNAGITLVHDAGWTPDHVLDVASDDTVVWDELPSGEYTVFEYTGAVDGTLISIDGGPAVPHDGDPVPVEVGQDVVVFNPDVTLDLTDHPDPTDPEDTDDTDPTVPDDSDPEGPGGDLPTTGSGSTGTLAAGALAAGVLGVGCTAIARRRR
jgi:hypothetical protein